MYEKKLFDDWSDTYDESVRKSDENNRYPFAGYSTIQRSIYETIMRKNANDILEMGIGTGQMTKALYENGQRITGVDFSSNMIEKAKAMMPNNTYINSTFNDALMQLKDKKFDVILFSYSIHHINYDAQLALLNQLLNQLSSDGIILIGDVMTKTKKEMTLLASSQGKYWDDEEYYPIAEFFESEKSLFNVKDYTQVTFCSGIVTLSKKEL